MELKFTWWEHQGLPIAHERDGWAIDCAVLSLLGLISMAYNGDFKWLSAEIHSQKLKYLWFPYQYIRDTANLWLIPKYEKEEIYDQKPIFML